MEEKWPITHVKPHGALNNMACENFDIAFTIGQTIKKFNKDLIYVVLPLNEMEKAAKKLNMKYACEIFADRNYEDNGQLFSRLKENASIDDPNPILFFEHKAMYRSIKGSVPNNNYNIEIGKGDIKKKGTDLTIITYGMGVHWSLEISKKLELEMIDIEVVDLRSLIPWDKELVEKSIKKTNRVLILHEANITGGVGAEISAYINEYFFEFLDAPVMRLGSLDIPIPFASDIENNIYLPINRIEEKIKELIKF